MTNSMFFCNVEKNEKNAALIDLLATYVENTSTPVYVINAPLSVETHYEYEKSLVVLIPKHKITFINLGNSEPAFSNYCDDFIEDLGFLSDKYDYKVHLGRPRIWRNRLISDMDVSDVKDIDDILTVAALLDKEDQRNADFLISLLIGSINDINVIGGEYPESILDKVKKKIVLFDGDQSRFIYSKPAEQKRITIQGLAGTGKTELLLHKLKDLYVRDKSSRVVFTCFNKILAHSMEKRIPDFFNFMRVEEQIKWNERLWVMSSWGSRGLKNSGIYAYICSNYGLDFYSFSYSHTFDKVCSLALEELNKIENFEYCFDYILIDESQDFPESFFRLCEKVTQGTIYVAGDIFQDIYDRTISQSVKSDFLLNKCYRTDPKTLMFAHAVGMGLYEIPVIRWLNDEEWKACGYTVNRDNNEFLLSRIPLRRFEDIDMGEISSIVIEGCARDDMKEKVLDTISSIASHNPTVIPDDIAIVFVEGNSNFNYRLADDLAIAIPNKFGWRAVKGYEAKTKTSGAVFISNRNNVKGLEFPFVICVATGRITDNIFTRNTIYMILTRSFITSYFLVDNEPIKGESLDFNKDFIDIYSKASRAICDSGVMKLREPGKDEQEQQNHKVSIQVSKQMSIKEVIESVFLAYPKMPLKTKKSVTKAMLEYIGNEGNMTECEIIDRTHKMIAAFT